MLNYIIKTYYQAFAEEMSCAHAWHSAPSLSGLMIYLSSSFKRRAIRIIGRSAINGALLLNNYIGSNPFNQQALSALRLLTPSVHIVRLFQQRLTSVQLRDTITILENYWGAQNPLQRLSYFEEVGWEFLSSEVSRQRLLLEQKRIEDARPPLKEDFDQIKELYQKYVSEGGDRLCEKFLSEPEVASLLEHLQQYLLPAISEAMIQTEISRKQLIATEISKIRLKKDLRESFFRILSNGEFHILPYFFTPGWREFNELVEKDIVETSYARAVEMLEHNLLQLTEELQADIQQKRFTFAFKQARELFQNYKGDLTRYQSIAEKIILEPEVAALIEAGFDDFRLTLLTQFNSRASESQREDTMKTLLVSEQGALWFNLMNQSFEDVIFQKRLSQNQLRLIAGKWRASGYRFHTHSQSIKACIYNHSSRENAGEN